MKDILYPVVIVLILIGAGLVYKYQQDTSDRVILSLAERMKEEYKKGYSDGYSKGQLTGYSAGLVFAYAQQLKDKENSK